jgi:hypothetical protein
MAVNSMTPLAGKSQVSRFFNAHQLQGAYNQRMEGKYSNAATGSCMTNS